MARWFKRRSAISVPFQSRRLPIQVVPIVLAEPLEARCLLSAALVAPATVTGDLAGPLTVTVTPTAGQPDPAGAAGLNFTVTFSQPVTDFQYSDNPGNLIIGGTAPGTNEWSVMDASADQTTYTVDVQGMTGTGTVTLSVPAGVAHDAADDANLASTNTNNVINYQYMRFTKFTVPTRYSETSSIVTGPDGNLWFTEQYGNKIGKMTPNGNFTEYTVPGNSPEPEDICVGSDGNLWFTDWGAENIGRITTSGNITMFSSGLTSGFLYDITAGPNGNLWYAMDGYIGRMTTSGSHTLFHVGGNPYGITAGPDGNIWYTDWLADKIGQFSLTTYANTFFTSGIPTTGRPWMMNITTGPDGNLWFAQDAAGGAYAKIGRITTAGVVTMFSTGITDSYINSITSGADGNVWYAANYTVAKVTPAGVITAYSNQSGAAGGLGITLGPDQKIWTANDTMLVRLDLSAALPVTINQAATQADPTGTEPMNFTVVFARPVTGFSASSLVFSSTAFGTPVGTITDSGDHMTYNVAVSGLTSGGTLTVGLAGGAAQDAGGNLSQVATSTDNTVTFLPLTAYVGLAYGQAAITNATPVDFQAVFNTPVVDFNSGDVALSSGTAPGAQVTAITDSGDHMTYTVEVRGMADSGTVIAAIPAGLVHDAAGDANLASSDDNNVVTYDVTRPTVTIDAAASQANPATTQPINYTVVFSKPVVGFNAADVDLSSSTAPGATVEAVTDSGDHKTYTVSVGGMTDDGAVIATIDDSVVHDAAGNPNLASTSYYNDNAVWFTVPPTVTINLAVDQANPTQDMPIDFTVVFSKPVYDFYTDDVVLSGTAPGANVDWIADSGDEMTYDVYVDGMTGSGTVIAAIPGGVAHDTYGDANLPSTSTDNVVAYGNAQPTVTIDAAAGQANPSTTAPINYTVVFSWPVVDFNAADVDISNSTAPGAAVQAVADSGDHRAYTVSVGGMTDDGDVVATIDSSVVDDAFGDANQASTSTNNDNDVKFISLPTVTIAPAEYQPDPTNSLPIDFVVVFSKPMVDFNTADVVLSGTAPGATVEEIDDDGDEMAYDVYVDGMTAGGTVIANIPGGFVHDAAGDANLPSTSTDNTVTYDITPPTVSFKQMVSQPNPQALDFTVVFSKPVVNFNWSDVDVSDSTAPGAEVDTVTDSGDGMTYDVLVDGMYGSGTVTATIYSGEVQDAAGNWNANYASYTVAYTAPLNMTPPGDQTAVAGQSTAFALGSFTQYQATSPFTVYVSWGDGSADDIFSVPGAGVIPPHAHTYTSAGNDTVYVEVSDAANNYSYTSFNVAVTPAAPAPAWLGNSSAATWNPSTQTLTVTGNATITGDPATYGVAAIITADAGSHVMLGTAVAHIAGLTLQSGATMDIASNTLLINYGNCSSPLAAVQNAVTNGSLLSHTANAGPKGQYTVGYADSTEMSAVPSGNVELMYTLTGDSRLTGTVNFLDYSILQNNYNQTGRDWAQGDWNDDGTVNFLDYSLLQNNYNQSVPAAVAGAVAAASAATHPASSSAAAVPPAWSSDQNVFDTDAVSYGWSGEDSSGYVL